ncbi:MAG: hypothetical protein ACLFV7_10890 [Phycisphaerae bacterium]
MSSQHNHSGRADDRRFSRWRPHPWHGLEVGQDPPERVTAFIEMTPYDLVKFEIDKASGHLRVDRPQRSSSLCPTCRGSYRERSAAPERLISARPRPAATETRWISAW